MSGRIATGKRVNVPHGIVSMPTYRLKPEDAPGAR
jgi:hypothetical protein